LKNVVISNPQNSVGLTSQILTRVLIEDPTATLPAPWQQKILGTVSDSSPTVFAENAIGSAVVGGRSNTSDAGRFVYQSRSGDGVITAFIDAPLPAQNAARFAVMVRGTTGNEGPMASAQVAGSSTVGTNLAVRTSNKGQIALTPGGSNNQIAPRWVRLTRSGNLFTAETSTDGGVWTLLGSATVDVPTSAHWGLFHHGDTSDNFQIARFRYVTITNVGELSAPTGFTATAQAPASIALAWDPVGGATGYEIERRPRNGTYALHQTLPHGTTSFVDSVLPGERYEYRLRATQGALVSPTVETAQRVDGTWINASGGDWTTTANWQGGTEAGGPGATANFNTLDLTGNRTITVNANATFGTLNVGDTTAPLNNYTFAVPGAGNFTWTLDNGASAPVINVTAGTATLQRFGTSSTSFVLSHGTSNIVKDGPGTLSFDPVNFSGAGGLYIKQGVVQAISTLVPAGGIIMGDGSTEVTLSAIFGKTSLALGTRAITLNAGTQTIAALAGSGTLSTGLFSGSGALSLLPVAGSSGRTTFGNANSNYTGGTTIGAVGTDKIIVAINASSKFSGGNVTRGPLGTGTVTLAGGGLSLTNADRTLHNPIVVTQNSELWDANSATVTRTLTLAGPVTLSGGTRELTINIARTDGSGKVVISGAIGDGGNGYGLTVKSGSATPGTDVLELTGANTYTGSTVVESGALRLSGGGSIASSPAVTVNGTLDVAGVSGGFAVVAGQSLGGTGVVTGAVSVAASGILKPGSGGATRGTLTFNNNLDLAPGARLEIDLGTTSGDCDKVAAGGALDLQGAVLKLSSSAALVVGNKYTVVSGTTPFTGKFASVESDQNAVSIDYTANAGKDVVVTITKTNTPYQQWLQTHGLPMDGSGNGAPGVSLSNDGIPNTMKFALGLSPQTPGYSDRLAFSRVESGGQFFNALTYRRPEPIPAGNVYAVQMSGNLVDWSDSASLEIANSVAGGFRTITIRDTIPAGPANPRRFIRLKVTIP
jgi:autotransporter-associated beta strand protein